MSIVVVAAKASMTVVFRFIFVDDVSSLVVVVVLVVVLVLVLVVVLVVELRREDTWMNKMSSNRSMTKRKQNKTVRGPLYRG